MFMEVVTSSTTQNLIRKINMNTNTIIKFIIVIVLFVIGWNLENRTLSFIFFTLPWLIILYPVFLGKKKGK